MRGPSPDSSSEFKPRSRWYNLYYLLAAFDIATIVLSVFLTHRVLAIHRESVSEGQLWAGRASNIAKMVDLAGDANAPGNDAFESGDIPFENGRLDIAIKHYEEQYRKVTDEMQQNVPADVAGPLSMLLIKFDTEVHAIESEALTIFRLLGKGDQEAAGNHMAEMDRALTRAMAQNTELREAVRSIQTVRYNAFTDQAARMARFAFWNIVMVVATITGAIFFAVLSRRLARAEQEQLTAYQLVRRQHTELKEYASKLEATGEDLRSHSEELQEEKIRSDQANVAKSQFLANMSHEIRTPLNGVIGMLDLLAGTNMDSRQTRFIGIAKSSASTLLSLINDVLDFSKIEAGKLELDHFPFNLQLLLEDVSEMFSHRAVSKNLELSCHVRTDVPTQVRGDQERLRQILTNFMGNAIKFTEKGEVRIRAELIQRQGDEAEIKISVCDTGIGIPDDRISRLFSPFTQVDSSTTRKYGGTGLGLAISRQLIELMGGRFGVDSQLGRGSSFWMSIPFPVECEVNGLRGTRESFAGVHVLAVDDTATNLVILEEQLTSWGMKVTVVSDAEIGLKILRKFQKKGMPFPLVLLDHHMPKMSGIEMAAQIKQDPNLAQTKLLMLSSDDTSIERRQWAELGLCGMVTKPIRSSRLFDVITDALNNRSSLVVPSPVDDEHRSLHDSKTFRVGRVLICEDNDINQLVTSEVVSSAGYEVLVADNGRLGVEAVQRGGIDLVLMDCQMPEMDGFDATREIRRLEASGQLKHHFSGPLPIVALTANALQGDRQRCDAAGMDDYVTKPVDRAVLIRAIERNMKAVQIHQEIVSNDTPTAPVVPVNEVFQPDDLLARCGGDRTFTRRLLRKFHDRLPSDRDTLTAAVLRRSRDEAATIAHTLKGTAGNMSAIPLRSVAADLETHCKAGEWEHSERSLDQLFDEINRCMTALTQLETSAETL